jgi:hypothetical protein
MRLSEWRAASPSREATSAKVNALVDAILLALGTDADPSAWVAWGDDPSARYTILAPTPAGLVSCFVRVNVPGEGPRATAKLTRWGRLQVGELAVESQAGHRLISFQVEGIVLRGADAEAERIGRFAVELLAAIDGRPLPEASRPTRRGGRSAGSARSAGRAAPSTRPGPSSAKSSATKAATAAPKRSGSSATTSRRG